MTSFSLSGRVARVKMPASHNKDRRFINVVFLLFGRREAGTSSYRVGESELGEGLTVTFSASKWPLHLRDIFYRKLSMLPILLLVLVSPTIRLRILLWNSMSSFGQLIGNLFMDPISYVLLAFFPSAVPSLLYCSPRCAIASFPAHHPFFKPLLCFVLYHS